MLQGAFWILAAVLAAVGAVQVVCAVADAMLAPKVRPESLLVVPVDGRVENVEQVVRYAHHTAQRCSSHCRLFLLDLGMEEEAREICRRFLAETPGSLLGTEEDFLRLLQREGEGA